MSTPAKDLLLATDPSKINPAGAEPQDIEEYQKSLQDTIKSLEDRYAQPNWFKVAAGFAKPQLGGFMASLGSASEALGENVEQQRASALPIAQMRAQLAQSKISMGQNKKVADLLENHKGPVTEELVKELIRLAPDAPSTKAAQAQLKTSMESQAQARQLARDAFDSGLISKSQFGSEVAALRQKTVLNKPEPENSNLTNPVAKPSGITAANIGAVESKNKPFAEGPNVPGQGTAKSEMQVMDKTADNPGFGVAPAKLTGDKVKDEAERVRVGSDYFEALKNHFGNESLAAAAYNWGPSNVEKWVKEGADPEKMPASVRDYVAKSHLHASKNVPSNVSNQSAQDFERAGASGPQAQELVKGQLSEGDKMWAPQVEAIISNPLKVTEKRASEFHRAGTLLNQPDVQNAMGLTFKEQGFGTAFATALKEGFNFAATSPGGAYSAGVSAPVDKILEAYKVAPPVRAKLIELSRIAMDDALTDLREGTKALGGGHASTTEFQGLMSRMAHTTEPYKLMNQYFAKRAVENSLNEKLHEHWLDYSSSPDFARKPYSEFFKSKEYKDAIKEYGKQFRKAQSVAD